MSSSVITTLKFSGSVFSNSLRISRIALEASIAFALSLNVSSKVTASSPLTLAYEVKSLKVLFTVAMSLKVTIASWVTFIGIE